MGLIRDLVPLNLHEETEKFLADKTYNPQFKYSRSFEQAELTKYGLPRKEYFDHAQSMLEQHGPQDLPIDNFLTPAEIATFVFDLVKKLGLPELPVHFEPNRIGQIMLSADGLHLRVPIKFDLDSLIGKTNHEIQSHYLRKYNQLQQSWNLKTSTKKGLEFILTEEGLANINSFISRDDKIVKRTYLNYYAAYLAQELSFSQLFLSVKKHGVSDKIALNYTLKQKRGLEDTSQPGGFSKNHLYLEGMVAVSSWLATTKNPQLIYSGRISLNDIKKVEELDKSDKIVLPTFMRDLDQYLELVREIREVNHFDSLPTHEVFLS